MGSFVINRLSGRNILLPRTHGMGPSHCCPRIALLTDREAHALMVCGYIDQNHEIPTPDEPLDPHTLLATEIFQISPTCEYERLVVTLPAEPECHRSLMRLFDPWYDSNAPLLHEQSWVQPFRVSNKIGPKIESWWDDPAEPMGDW